MCFWNKGYGIGSGRDLLPVCFRNSAGEAYTSQYTYNYLFNLFVATSTSKHHVTIRNTSWLDEHKQNDGDSESTSTSQNKGKHEPTSLVETIQISSKQIIDPSSKLFWRCLWLSLCMWSCQLGMSVCSMAELACCSGNRLSGRLARTSLRAQNIIFQSWTMKTYKQICHDK